MRLIYNLFIHVYTLSITLYAAFNDKANLWINGRKHWKKKLQEIDFKGQKIYWFHCASLGEFEQGRPLIEEIKAKGHCKILLTFFSPSVAKSLEKISEIRPFQELWTATTLEICDDESQNQRPALSLHQKKEILTKLKQLEIDVEKPASRSSKRTPRNG